MQSFFLFYLNVWESVLPEINDGQKYLQIKELNVHECDIKLNSLQSHFVVQGGALEENAVIAAKIIGGELEISTEHPVKCLENIDI